MAHSLLRLPLFEISLAMLGGRSLLFVVLRSLLIRGSIVGIRQRLVEQFHHESFNLVLEFTLTSLLILQLLHLCVSNMAV